MVADLRTLDDEDETAFAIAISAHLAEGNRVSARREYDRYAAVLTAYGATPPPMTDASMRDFAEETA